MLSPVPVTVLATDIIVGDAMALGVGKFVGVVVAVFTLRFRGETGHTWGMDEGTIRQIDAVLAAFDGVETDISSAGRENTRTVNRIARLATLKRISGETTFRRTVTRYVVSGTERELMIGAERVGGGTWRLIARWSDERAPA